MCNIDISGNYFTYTAYELLLSLPYAVTNVLARARWQAVKETAINQLKSIYAPFGAFIVFHRQYFESGGHLSYGSFLFGEEIFITETARRFQTLPS